MCPSAQRLLSVLMLAFWMAPSVMALGVGLHTVLDDPYHHKAQHAHDVADLAGRRSIGITTMPKRPRTAGTKRSSRGTRIKWTKHNGFID